MGDRVLSLTNHEVYVVTACDGSQKSGMIVTWLMPGTLVPDKQRIVCVLSVSNYTFELLQRSGRFLVHLLADSQVDWVPRFGLPSGRNQDKFAGIELEDDPSGAPRLPGTCGIMRCSVTHTLPLGDRTIVVADIEAQELGPAETPLTKRAAFAALPEDIVEQLVAKATGDGKRDADLID